MHFNALCGCSKKVYWSKMHHLPKPSNRCSFTIFISCSHLLRNLIEIKVFK